MEITRLRTLHMDSPLGIDTTPYFSWVLQSTAQNVFQESYRIRVMDEEGRLAWDSGICASKENTFIRYEGEALRSFTRYLWTVEVSDDRGERAEAEAFFETAFMEEAFAGSLWIESPEPVKERSEGFGNQAPATMFRREFAAGDDAAITRARLYVTARGIYRAYINGRRADDGELAPGYSAYDAYLPYQTYDVTDLVRAGENCLGFAVADGWYYCLETAIHKEEAKNGAHALRYVLRVSYADGSTKTWASDGSERAANGPVQSADLFAGELYDARLEIPGWDLPGQELTGWTKVQCGAETKAAFMATPDDRIRPVKEFAATKLWEAPSGDLLADFGQNMAGRVRVRVDLPEGWRISLEHFEVLDEQGEFFNSILSTTGVGAGADQRVDFISAGGPAVYEPMFTYLGFRYVRIRFYDAEGEECTGAARPVPAAEDLTAVALSTAKEELGSFACSDADLNRLYSNIRWSQYSNMISIPTDCPQREKAGWTGDAGIYIETALLNEDVTPFFTRWLKSVAADQQSDGAVPMVVPFNETYRSMSTMMTQMMGLQGIASPAGWGDASVKVPWVMYETTGNRDILRWAYPMMKGWCDYVIRQAAVCGRPDLPPEKERYLWNTGFQYGEWLIPSTSRGGFDDQAAVGMAMMQTAQYVAPVYGYASVRTLAQAAELLGKAEDAEFYKETAAKMKEAIMDCLISPEGQLPAKYMGAYVLFMYFDLAPQALRPVMTQRILTAIRENGGCLDTGFLATPYLLEVLEKEGCLETAYDLLFQKRCPSWLYEVEQGATTIWETWNAVGEEGVPQHVSMNHYSFGCVAQWMFRVIGGIDRAEPGYRWIRIAPRVDARLDWARREYLSEQGKVACAWKRTKEGIQVEVTVPCNTRAEVVLPDGQTFEVGSGSYRYMSH